jgi:hypothetical protein
MDEKLKAVSATGENAEKDEALLECIKEVWNLMENRIQSLEEKEVNIQSLLESSVCRLNNDESQLKLCENKQLIPQIVLQDDFKPHKSNLNPEPVKLKSLAEYVHDSVQIGLNIVDQKQICVEMHSEMTDETLKVFEDVNPYLIRDLPPLIGSSAFETGSFAKNQTKNVSSPVDDVIIELPQPLISKNIPSASLNGIPVTTVPPPAPQPPPLSVSTIIPVPTAIQQQPLPHPKLLTSTIQKDDNNDEIQNAKNEPTIIKPSTPPPVPSVKSNGILKNHDTLSQNIQISNDVKSDTSTVTPPIANKRGPPNLAEIIKNAPAIKREEPKKKQNLSLFDDDEEDEPLAKSVITPKIVVPPPRKQSLSNSKPPSTVVEASKISVPQSKPRTIVPTPQPEAPPRKASPVTTAKKTPPTTVKAVQPRKHKSLFSSSDEDDDVPIKGISKSKAEQNRSISKDVPSSSTAKPVAPKRGQQPVNNARNYFIVS